MEDDRLFELEIITPERVFYKGKVKMLELNTGEGQIGIYSNHIPLTTMLEPGIASITEENQKRKAVLHTGFVQILKDQVRVLAEAAEWPEEIDKNRAREAKIRAERRMDDNTSDISLTRAELSLRKALVRIQASEN